MSDPKVIYLGPACEAETGDDRTWAEDNPWPDCECGHRPVQYVHGETFERMKAEREALQLLMNDRDDQLTSLEQRRHAEQQACQAAERRVEELEAAMDQVRLHCDSYPEKAIGMKALYVRQMLDIATKALNPTAETVSHVAKRALSMENQRIQPARFKCLACGDYHDGSGNLPCPKMSPTSGVKP